MGIAGRTIRAALACSLLLAVAAPGPAFGQQGDWYAGDGHVHTCYSHDAYCGPSDDNTGPDVIYSSGGSVGQRFAEAAAKGLDFLVISDHDDIRAHTDPDFGTQGVLGLHAYEASLDGGHAHMLGATRHYDEGDGGGAATNAMADALRLDGGRFQANHPTYRAQASFDSCEQAELPNWDDIALHWKYGYSVRPDSIEVWNATTLIQPSELYWECWLQRGVRVGGTAGSDSHGATQPTIAMPTTWVFAASPSEADILAAIGAGRTTLSRNPPAFGGARLLIEGDADGDGRYESGIGSQVPPGAPLRVRAEGLPGMGLVRVRQNGETLLDGEQLAPGGAVELEAPADGGWTRATLYLADGTAAVDPGCMPIDQPFDTCTEDLAIAAMTSPIYAGAPVEPMPESPGSPPGTPEADEPDDDGPLAARPQSNGAAPLPAVPSQRRFGAALGSLRVRVVRFSLDGRSALVRVIWPLAKARVQVQLRRAGRWRTLHAATSRRTLLVRLRRGRTHAIRARTVPRYALAGPWRRVRVRP